MQLVATFFILLGIWLVWSAPLSSAWGARVNRWQLRLLLGEVRSGVDAARRERLIDGLSMANLWLQRTLGVLMVGVGIVALVRGV